MGSERAGCRCVVLLWRRVAAGLRRVCSGPLLRAAAVLRARASHARRARARARSRDRHRADCARARASRATHATLEQVNDEILIKNK